MLVRMWQNKNPYTLLVGMQISTTTMESSMEIPQKLEIELSFDPVILLLVIYPKECKTGYSRDTCTPMFITALFTIADLWKQPRCPTTDEWIMKSWYIYTMEYDTATRNNDMGFEGKWMQLEDIMLNEVSQDQKHKKDAFSLIHGRYIQT
jgi:uncharacterized membrane protein